MRLILNRTCLVSAAIGHGIGLRKPRFDESFSPSILPSQLNHLARLIALLVLCFTALAPLAVPCHAQELDPRRWSHLPIDTNFAAVRYAYTEADITLDPTLLIEGGKKEMHTWAFGYIRTFKLLDKSARFDLVQAWEKGRWNGLLDGVPAATDRGGMSDTSARFAINLIGAPPLAGKEYAAYRAAVKKETIVGAALAVQLPTGEYKKDKLINLGRNRYTFRPQLGVVHNRNRWSFEVTGAAWFFTNNESFFEGNRLEQDPFYTLQAHVVHTFHSRLWLHAGAGYGYGGETAVNGVDKNNRKENFVWGIGAGYPITRQLAIKAGYIQTRSQTSIGEDSDTITIGFSTFW